ncbi:ATP/GTP-binding protein [Streptomyces sp. NPDC057072]|uniref:ATP/GTP-binding protein n=1 Tax=Streptomyces sp. NPDC057072 TaxID=3346014 RepID=UPI00363A8EB9
MLTYSRSAAAALALAIVLSSAEFAHAGGDPTVAPPSDCGDMRVCIGVSAGGFNDKSTDHSGHKPTAKGTSGKKRSCSAYFAGSKAGGPDEKGSGEYEVPCEDVELGSFSGGCYYKKADPQPAAGDSAWRGHQPGDGAIYQRSCPFGVPGNEVLAEGFVWMAQPPTAAVVDPAQLAQQAVDKMRLAGPDIASPRAAGEYVVGVPMWMWVDQSPTTYGPNSASATAGGVTVTATAKVSKIVWKMGDGSVVTCHGPGKKYSAVYGLQESPSCGHTYTATSASQPAGAYTVTATSTWTVDWQVVGGGGESGRLVESRQSQMQVAIGELQVVR